MTDHPLGEVQVPVDPARRLEGTLNAGDEIEHGGSDGETQRHIGDHHGPLAFHRHKEIGQHRQHGHQKKR